MIAIALACGPKLLFADEPTTALDVTVQAQILDLLQAQQRERFMAMILVTHDLGVVAGRTDDIAVMYAGRSSRRRRPRSLFARHAASVHRGAAEVDPEARAAEPHPARRDRRPAARPREPAAGLQVRAALPVRAGRSASTEEPPLIDARRRPATRSGAGSRSGTEAGRTRWRATSPRARPRRAAGRGDGGAVVTEHGVVA